MADAPRDLPSLPTATFRVSTPLVVGLLAGIVPTPPGAVRDRLFDLVLPWLVALLALYPILYVSAFARELGHALLGRWSGFLVTAFGLGTGRPFWVGRF